MKMNSMAKRKSKLKTKKKAVRSSASTNAARGPKRKAQISNQKLLDLMELLKNYLRPNNSRNIDQSRLKRLMKITGKDRQALKAAYLYGVGNAEFWFQIEDELFPIDYPMLKQLRDSWPSIEKKVKNFPPELLDLHSTLAKLTTEDQIKLNLLLETFVKASKMNTKKLRSKN